MALLLPLIAASCIKNIDLSQNKGDKNLSIGSVYGYPFQDEAQNVVTEIIIKTNKDITTDQIQTEIPRLKYNKSWLMLLTQDDCKQAAYSCTWAAINGKPLSKKYFYDTDHLRTGDMPPDAYFLNKTLGSTDGAGNEVRFAFTTTLAPGWEWMNAKTMLKPGYTKDFYRFYMKSGLIWDNVKEMLNYGCGIAFHDVKITEVNNSDKILAHFPIAQDTILKKLSGRGCKMLAEPNGNKSYINAALNYPPIQIMAAQTGATKLYPLKVENDLHKIVAEREFNDSPDYFEPVIENELQRPAKERKAIYIGVHGTDTGWVNLLLRLNNTYGKDGDDSVWFPSHEEYYEYNYYRIHGVTRVTRVDNRTLKLTVNLPSGEYFYYPSVTVNLKGLKQPDVASVISEDAVAGLSYSGYKDGLMLNIDCRKHLVAHATHYVEQYEKDKSNKSNKADALYFVNMLKESAQKSSLLSRIK